MVEVKVFYEQTSNTLTVRFGNSQEKYVQASAIAGGV